MLTDCSQFALGSRQRQVCEGDAGWTLARVNAFRLMHGIEPFADDAEIETDATDASSNPPSVAVVRRLTPPTGRTTGSCCGGNKLPPGFVARRMVEGTGVGGRLIEVFKSHGFEACDACYELARRMNEWGPDGCRDNIELIVADILPRALEWESSKVGWWAQLLPTAVTSAALRKIVSDAIDTAKPLEWIDVPQTQPVADIIPVKPRPSRLKNVNNYANEVIEKLPSPTGPPIETIDTSDLVRHLTFHIYPVAKFGAWQWNCDRLLAASHLFNGRRIVAIAVDGTTDSDFEVRRYLADFTDEFIVVQNNTILREVATWLPMLERLREHDSERDVTFSCHAKGVRHKLVPDESEGSTVFRWTQAQWELGTHWPSIEPLLQGHATAGAFRRYVSHSPKLGFGQWHYSGTFYWWRNRDVFRRSWRNVPKSFIGTEAWPGLLFAPHEAGVTLGDDVHDLYQMHYWQNAIEPQLAKWRMEHAT